jgi:hypothetical protein
MSQECRLPASARSLLASISAWTSGVMLGTILNALGGLVLKPVLSYLQQKSSAARDVRLADVGQRDQAHEPGMSAAGIRPQLVGLDLGLDERDGVLKPVLSYLQQKSSAARDVRLAEIGSEKDQAIALVR